MLFHCDREPLAWRTIYHFIVSVTPEMDNEMGRLSGLCGLRGGGFRSRDAIAVDLPSLAAGCVQGSEPTATPAEGVDADQMAQVEDFAGLLRGVAEDSRFSGNVRPRHPQLERLPPHGLPMLLGERTIRVVISVGKKMRVGFEIIAPGADVFDVRLRNLARAKRLPVRSHRGRAADFQPVVGLGLPVDIVEHHFFMIAQQRDELAAVAEAEKLVDHLPAFRTAVDAVAEHDHRIVGPEIEHFNKSAQAPSHIRGHHQ